MTPPWQCRKGLGHCDRWLVADMLREQPDLICEDPSRDINLWRHLFAPDDLVRVGNVFCPASQAEPSEWCSGNIWSGNAIVATVVVCWPSSLLLRGATYKDRMDRSQTCEAVLGRLRAAGMEIAMVVEDGEDGLECWIDPIPGSHPVPCLGRCPGGVNRRTGVPHRVVWAHPVTRMGWGDDDWPA
jgi:hypothetical protein